MKKVALRCWLALALCSLLGTGSCGAQNAKNTGDEVRIAMDETSGSVAADFSRYFSYEPLGVAYDAAEYDLPLKASDIDGFETAMSRLGLNDKAQALLLKHGFAVTDFTPRAGCDDVVAAYDAITERDLPVFVTSGSLLHVYHVLFDDLLRSVETGYLYDDVWNLCHGLYGVSADIYRESEGDLKEAARRDMVFLAVGLSLLKPAEDQVRERPQQGRFVEPDTGNEFGPEDLETYRFDVGDVIGQEVSAELRLITKHEGFAASPLFKYEEDYSQYVPRGHYTTTEKLKNYFRAMMWLGRMSMLLKGSEDVKPGGTCRTCDAFISKYDARVQTLGAMIVASAAGADANLMERWQRTYKVTSFFVGYSDDLGPYEYLEAMNEVFGSGAYPETYTDTDHQGLKAKLAEYRSPLIYGGTGDCMILPPFTPEQADECLDKTRGFRLMGQRFVPDSYILSKIVAPYTGDFRGGDLPFTAFPVPGLGIHRVFPRGLDVMAVLGSERARVILDELDDTNYKDFDKAFAEIRQEIGGIDEADWNQNLYWNWLWTLRALLSGFGSAYPTFMQTEAWKDRLLTVALASWTELRHDTILYVKQSYTLALGAAPEPSEGRGYVEPVPEFYNRLLSLTRMTRLGLESMNVLERRQAGSLRNLEHTLERLVSISLAELRGEPVGADDIGFLGRFGEVLDGILGDIDDESRKTTIVADVHTDANSGKVLEEGCGDVDLLVVAWQDFGGISLAAGPELSYYEFKHPMDDRLTDEAWREMLVTNPPARPPWTHP